MWPIGESSCDQILNSEAFDILECSTQLLKTEKEKKKDNQHKLYKVMASPLA